MAQVLKDGEWVRVTELDGDLVMHEGETLRYDPYTRQYTKV